MGGKVSRQSSADSDLNICVFFGATNLYLALRLVIAQIAPISEMSAQQPKLSSTRLSKFKAVAQRRQPTLTIILENIRDPHNIAAVLRSADSVGCCEVFILYTEKVVEKLEISRNISGGTKKWLDIHLYNDAEACFREVRKRYDTILATHLGREATSIYTCDFTGRVAFLFGNERDGLSANALSYADANVVIPQVGMAQSLNLSVACAVTLYEAYRQRAAAGYYTDALPLAPAEQTALYEGYLARSTDSKHNWFITPKAD